MYMARSDQQFPLRLPPELKEKLEDAAKESGRSKNAEAVYRLEQSFNEQSPLPLSAEHLEQITKAAGASYMAVIAKHLEIMNEEDGNKLLRDIVKEAAEDFKRY